MILASVGYVVAGWTVSLATLAIYAWSLYSRSRRLSAQVPAERSRWMTTEDTATTFVNEAQ